MILRALIAIAIAIAVLPLTDWLLRLEGRIRGRS